MRSTCSAAMPAPLIWRSKSRTFIGWSATCFSSPRQTSSCHLDLKTLSVGRSKSERMAPVRESGSMDYEEIYRFHAREYDELVSAEDCEGNLLPALEAVAPLCGVEALEVGVG